MAGVFSDVSTVNTPIVHLTSSSPDDIKVTIMVETVKDFYIKLNSVTNLTSTPSQPKYYFYPFDQNVDDTIDLLTQNVRRKHMCHEELDDTEQRKLQSYLLKSQESQDKGDSWLSRPKSVILLIESDDDICAVVSIQNFSVSYIHVAYIGYQT
jgi:hypothetical protein